MRILAAFGMGRRTAEGAGWPLGYGSEWVWADGEVCQSPDQFDPEPLRPYGAFLNDAAAAELADAS
jgi:hypothetical protein